MSVRTRTRHTKNKTASKEDWRDLLETDSDSYGEGATALRGLRYRDGFTQQELADLLQIHRHHISEMETGKRSISKDIAKKLAKVFNINYRFFL